MAERKSDAEAAALIAAARNLSDRELARLLGRTPQAITGQRRIHGIANVVPAPPQRPWKRWEARLLGTHP